MKVTLNRLHKYRKILKEDILYGPTLYLNRFFTVNLSDKVENCVSNVDRFVEEQKKQIERYNALGKDFLNVNVLLFEANVTTGLNEVLNALPHYNRLLNTYRSWKKSGKRDPNNPHYANTSMLTQHLLAIKGENVIVEIEVEDEMIIQEKILELTRILRELEDKKDKINNEHTVELELSNYGKELLGLL